MPFFKPIVEELQERKPFILWSKDHPERYGENGIIVRDFDDLCKKTSSETVAEDILDSFEKSEIHWNGYNGANRPVIWPDELMMWHDGCCLDFAIFAHMIFDYHDIDHAIGFIGYREKIPTGYPLDGHAFVLYIQNSQTYIWNYFGYDTERNIAYFDINGPFLDYQHALQYVAPYFSVLYQSQTKPYASLSGPRDAAVLAFYPDDNLTAIDVAYERHMRINQAQLIKMMVEDDKRRSVHEASCLTNTAIVASKPSVKGIQAFMRLMSKKSIFRNPKRAGLFKRK